jgi:hypothetical protein
MSGSEFTQVTSKLIFSVFLVGGSLLCVTLFGAMIWALSSSTLDHSGIVTQKRIVVALFFMWGGMIGMTIGGTLYLSDL